MNNWEWGGGDIKKEKEKKKKKSNNILIEKYFCLTISIQLLVSLMEIIEQKNIPLCRYQSLMRIQLSLFYSLGFN